MEPEPNAAGASVNRGLIEYTHWIYGLHALSVLTGVLGVRTVAGRFVWSVPSLIAVIMNYARRSETHGTWLESHFRWQIRTFWYAWLWIFVVSIVSIPLILILIGILVALVGYALIGVWIIYRVARGWLALREGRAMPLPPA
jgi:uncharacterized membrane protein